MFDHNNSLAHKLASGQARLSVAPMMDWTTREYRYFARLLNPNVWLYTEMVTTGAILHGDKNRHLDFNAAEQPLALQLGGSDPSQLAECVRIAEDWGYQEVNLNVGCPSDRVQNNKIGACLMAEPELVAECFSKMQSSVKIPVTVKHRIGIDQLDLYEDMLNFVDTVAKAGCRHFIVHARIAWLKGLSPKENREIPPLRYEEVYQLKKERPQLKIEINGGIQSTEEIQQHLVQTDGVMVGRAAYHDPYHILAESNPLWQQPTPDRFEVLDKFYPYIEQRMQQGLPLHLCTKHILGLFHNQKGARKWRQILSGGPSITLADVINASNQLKQEMCA